MPGDIGGRIGRLTCEKQIAWSFSVVPPAPLPGLHEMSVHPKRCRRFLAFGAC
ncbi:hypothetical protein SAMN05446935_7679 [Burkholderia sp. YR290]|jgi:hypothetical protein|nr:hypothetical protein SAMN05446935_7544 [Burkholderia sp. YR290]SOE87118.1 hypothetical protein SAMN05446935_7679 [Burkholderia sp. YR290]